MTSKLFTIHMQSLKPETVLINFNNYKYNFFAQLLKYSNDKWLLKRMNSNESWKAKSFSNSLKIQKIMQ